ncbi:MAG: class I tRNA ligase family protein [Mycoplasma sp.]|nr:class I tRNA ligase family protein [Mycoplasma sp.]
MYKHKKIEKKWQKYWIKNKVFKTSNKNNKKFYALDMFPYPSGSGLHVGHPEGYTATDIVARYKRLNGFDVLHPIGWDAFGLPAEQYALKTGNHPKDFTQKNINNFRRQIKELGFSYDYDKEIDTTDHKYYKITQWIFKQMYKKGLAEIQDIEVNWCQELGTVLANEEIIILEDGRKVSERGEFDVVKKPMKQWVLKITNYADKLLDGLNEVNWPKSLISLQKNWIGKKTDKDGNTIYHLRDWIFARQRYWGEPFPVVFDEDNKIILIDEVVKLPDMKEIKTSGNGESPLANNKEWVFFEKDGKKYRRDTNTMPQWAGSSWYYLAYILKNDDGTYLDIESKEAKERFKKWMPVDLYIGGQEHAVLHLLYARFWHKVLFDLGIVNTKEPFLKIVNQGMILGPDGQKMSKSKGNVINPDDIIDEFGADTLRVYEMFMGPLIETKSWSTKSIKGIRKWLERIIRMFDFEYKISETISEFNLLVKDVTKDIEDLKFNTAISKMMVYVNSVFKKQGTSKEELKEFLIILSVFAPHISEELLEKIGEKPINNQNWPIFDENKIKKPKIIIAVQVLGKLRATLEFNDKPSQEDVEKKALENKNVKRFIDGKKIVKKIYISNKIFNFVIK